MFNILLISVIAVTLAQDIRFDGERRRLKVNDGRLNQEAHRERTDQRQVIHENVGGFQNGNFAYTDGILKTNLNSSQTVKERQDFRPREDTYLHEGAAFRRPGNGQFDVHSSRGRGEVSHQVTEPGEYGLNNNNEQENQTKQNTNDQSDEQRNQNVNYNAQSNNRGEGNLNRFNTQNTKINRQDDQSTNTDQYSVQKDQNSEYANREISNNQNRQSGRGQNTQQINNQRSESRSSETNERHITTNNYDRETIDREMSNQISNMYFKESTEPASDGRRTTSNEVRNGTKGQDDRWIWGGGGEEQSTTPLVDNRASFVGDQCPTGKVKFNNVCVDVD